MKMRHGDPDKVPLPATGRTDFQRVLTAMSLQVGDITTIPRADLKALLAFIVPLNAVLAQALRVFFEDGARTDTPARAALALALHGADPAKFRFEDCGICVAPLTCTCQPRADWLAHCRFLATCRDGI